MLFVVSTKQRAEMVATVQAEVEAWNANAPEGGRLECKALPSRDEHDVGVAAEAPQPVGGRDHREDRAARLRIMNALDLYCGARGATRGLMQAGFRVVGVDIIPQPRYCGDAFTQMDALEYLATADLSGFDLIWASPPCQRYTSLRHAPGKHRDANLIGPTRAALMKTGKPYVIENVEAALMWLRDPVMLCGSMFGLETHPHPNGWRLERHRLFETSFPLTAPQCRHDGRPVIGIYGGHFRDRRRAKGTNHKSGSNIPRELGFKAMGAPLGSMTVAEISDAIPPAYSRFVAEAWLTPARTPRPWKACLRSMLTD
jgi:DNA (cytosine-5)-methyltransferase 1